MCMKKVKEAAMGMSLAMGLVMSVCGATPGGLDKKYVGLLFDVINTTPSNVLSNIDKFEKNAPS